MTFGRCHDSSIRHTLILGLVGADVPSPLAAPAAIAGKPILLPGGTTVTVALTDKISSSTAKVGDTFGVRVSEDVIVDGYVVIAKDAGGQGEVMVVDRAGAHGHAGSLGVKIDWVYALDGDKVRLSSQNKTDQGENKAGASSTMTILSWALLGPVGLFAHNFVKGHDLEIDGGHPFKAFVDDSVHVTSTKQVGTNGGFAQ